VTSEEEVRRIALSLPGASERPSYGGRPSWRTEPRMFAWIRDEPEALVVWVDSLEDKDALIASEPHKFFTTPHYRGQPIVLVRLGAVGRDEVAELVLDSWRLRAPRRLVKQHDPARGGRAS
jgi:hypothetical protein